MAESIRKVNVIGHLNPDTDSICSAISYAYLKNALGPKIFEPRRCGNINRETAFVLKRWGAEEPELITSVRPQIKDLEYQKQKGINGEMSLYAVWNLMREEHQDTLCITDENEDLRGLVTVKDIANANMAIFDTDVLATARTSYRNVIETLNGEMVLGNPDDVITSGRVFVGTSPEMMEDTIEEGDIVLVTNRYETQHYAVGSGAACLIICCDAPVTRALKSSAEHHGCRIITTPYDTYAATRLICMSMPVRSIMLDHDLVEFSVNTTVEDVRKVMSSTRHRFFPVINEEGHFDGVITSANLFDIKRKHVILVDHNEVSQAVDGLSHAIILEIIDHHRIGSIETSAPALFRNQPVGCTCTIVKQMYDENGVTPPPHIAGLMLSAILSDTLTFRSPTCTDQDRIAAQELAGIVGVDIDAYADEMFEAGADLTGRTADEVFHGDFKVFSRGSARFGVGQGSYMTETSRRAAEDLLRPYLADAAKNEDLPIILYMFTDVKTQTTDLLYYGEGAEAVIKAAFGVEPEEGMAVLPGVVSRKKQMIPPLMNAFERLSEE